jgi:lipopolysaccharide export system permease protein
MLSTLDRYLSKEVALTFLAALLVLLVMVLSNKFAEYLNKAANGLLAQNAIWLLLGLQAIRFLVLLLPASFLLSIMLSLGRLYRDSEMTALTACGAGPGTLYRPLFSLAVPLALVLLVLSLYLVPRCVQWQLALQARAQQDAELSVFTPGTFRQLGGGKYVVYTGALAEDGKQLRQVFIRSLEKDGMAITVSKRGYQYIEPQSGERYIVLEDGNRYQGIPGHSDLQELRFQRLAVPVDAIPAESVSSRQEAVPTVWLWNSATPADRAELQARFSGPVSLLLFTFLGPLLAHARPREGRYGRVVGAVLIYTIYVNLLKVGEAWLATGKVWPVLGLWWVHGLLALVGVGFWVYRYGIRFPPGEAAA